MNELKKSVITLWESLSMTQKVSLIASMLAVFAVLIAVVYFSSRPQYTLLYANLPSEEAAKVVDFLQTKKIPFELQDGGRAVTVPANRVYELRLALASAGIPRASDTAGGVGFELFDKTNFGMSDFMQKANYNRALQGELARTIRQFEEIQESRVMVVIPEDRLFRPTQREAKASVFLRLKQNRVLTHEKVQAIQFLVANAVEGLQPDKVAVVDNYGRSLADNRQPNSLLALSGQQIEVVRSTEDHLREKAQSMLDQVLGPGQAVVRIVADLDFDQVQESSEKFDPTSAVVRQETSTTETSKSETESRTATPGVASNTQDTTGANANKAGSPNKTEQAKETVSNRYEINRTVESRQRASGVVKRITVAVMVNTRKVAATTPGGAPAEMPRNAQELKALENIVKQAVGFTQSNSRQDAIELKETSFVDLFGTPEEKPSTKEVVMGLSKWLPLASQIFLLILAIGVFFYFRNTFKNPASDEGTPGEFADLLHRFEEIEEKDEVIVNGNNGHVNGREHNGTPAFTGVLTVDEISKLIKENPANTTQAIKNWLTRN